MAPIAGATRCNAAISCSDRARSRASCAIRRVAATTQSPSWRISANRGLVAGLERTVASAAAGIAACDGQHFGERLRTSVGDASAADRRASGLRAQHRSVALATASADIAQARSASHHVVDRAGSIGHSPDGAARARRQALRCSHRPAPRPPSAFARAMHSAEHRRIADAASSADRREPPARRSHAQGSAARRAHAHSAASSMRRPALGDAPLELGAEVLDQALDRPGGGVAERADGVALDLLGDVEQAVDRRRRRRRLRAAAPSSATSSRCPRGTGCTGRSSHACRNS